MDFDFGEVSPRIATIVAGGLAACAAGMGALLASDDELTFRLVVGRALSSMALGVSAGAVLLLVPDADPLSIVGLAALIGSLGTSFLESIARVALDKFKGRKNGT